MTLRLRLFLTILAVAGPLGGVVFIGYRIVMQRTTDDLFTALALSHLADVPPEACASQSSARPPLIITLPTRRGGPFCERSVPTDVQIFLYDGTGKSQQRLAPTLPAELREQIKQGHIPDECNVDAGPQVGRYLPVSLPLGGSCAFALAVVPNVRPALLPPPALIVPVLLALIAVLVGVAPLVRRIRVLTVGVRAWQHDSNHALPLDRGGDELGELSKALCGASETIKSQHASLAARERAMREFVENTTHDLATPLTVLQGNLSALANGHHPETVQQAMNEAQYLGALLGNLALSAKMEVEAHTEAIMDLRDIVVRVVERHRSMAARFSVSIERSVPEVPVPIRADPTFAEQALTNLVGNAVRYNQPEGHVAMVLEVENGRFRLRALDDGPGLSEDECRRVLQRGERGDQARSRDSSGRGLGLAIVARVAEIHGWQFSLVPNEPSGLTAELTGATVVDEEI